MRKEGYYWVKYEGKWVIAEWAKSYIGGNELWWHMPGFSDKDNAFEEIDETPIIRQNCTNDTMFTLTEKDISDKGNEFRKLNGRILFNFSLQTHSDKSMPDDFVRQDEKASGLPYWTSKSAYFFDLSKVGTPLLKIENMPMLQRKENAIRLMEKYFPQEKREIQSIKIYSQPHGVKYLEIYF